MDGGVLLAQLFCFFSGVVGVHSVGVDNVSIDQENAFSLMYVHLHNPLSSTCISTLLLPLCWISRKLKQRSNSIEPAFSFVIAYNTCT